jgi:hypothetical protein
VTAVAVVLVSMVDAVNGSVPVKAIANVKLLATPFASFQANTPAAGMITKMLVGRCCELSGALVVCRVRTEPKDVNVLDWQGGCMSVRTAVSAIGLS